MMSNQPVTQQPMMMTGRPQVGGGGGWIQPSMVPLNCPPGLEYLASVNHIFVKQLVDLLEVVTGFETENKYQLLDSQGQRIYAAYEESNTCARLCLNSERPFVIHLYDAMNREVMRVVRQFQCCACPCCEGCGTRVDVEAPSGTNIGYIENECICGYGAAFAIKRSNGERILSIRRQCCACECYEAKFPVIDNTGAEVGEVRKQWSGFTQELFTDARTFGISFPVDLDVKAKALLIGACFLVGFMYYESKGNQSSNSSSSHHN